MRRIFKYPLPFTPDQAAVIEMPEGAEIVRLGRQWGEGVLWALVDDSAPLEPRRFLIIETGHELPRHAHYVGSWDAAPFVWHVVELAGEPLPDGLELPADAEAAYRLLTAAGFITRELRRTHPHGEMRAWVAPDDEPLTTEQIMAVATLQEHGFGPVVDK